MGKKVILLLFLMVLMVVPLVSAKIIQQGSNNFAEGYTIEHIQIGTFKTNQNINFDAHVFNISNGKMVTNTTSECMFYLHNSSGYHLLENEPMTYHTLESYWNYEVSGGNFSKVGSYSYLIQCNETSYGGFTSAGFDITYNGIVLTQAQSTIYIPLFLFLIFVFIITILGIKQLPSSNEKDEEGKILSVSYLKYLRPVGWFFLWMFFIAMLFLSSNIAFAFLGEQLFANILFVLFKVCFGLTPLIVVVWIIWIYRQMFHDKQMQKMLTRGIFPQGKL